MSDPEWSMIDIAGQTHRHVIVAQGTATEYKGHPTTLLMPDGQTMFCVWTIGHGGPCGPLKRSGDRGLTWSELLPVPDNWPKARNCPASYRLPDPSGRYRLFVYAGSYAGGIGMHRSVSKNGGRAWSPMEPIGLTCVMPFCTIEPIDGGRRLLGMTNIRRPGETEEEFAALLGFMQRNPQTQEEIYLPRGKCIYLVDDTIDDNPEGMGLFRHLIKTAKKLERYELLEAWGFETDLRGIPIARGPFTQLEVMVKNGVASRMAAQSGEVTSQFAGPRRVRLWTM